MRPQDALRGVRMTASDAVVYTVAVFGAIIFGYALGAALCGMACAIRRQVRRWRAK
jgi:hypothetical protein